MDHPCHKCGQSVEDGVPFCSHCGAPQIRVAIPEVVPAMAASAGESAPLPRAGVLESADAPSLALPLRWVQAVRPCVFAALLAAGAISLGLVFPAAVLGAGFLSVVFYQRNNLGTVIKAGTGALLGAVSGAVCFAILGIFLAAAGTVSDVRAKLREQMLEGAQRWAASHASDPQVQAALDSLKTPEGLAMMMIFAAVAFFLVSVLLAGIGGALGGIFFSRRGRP
ncbi:MAG TPA: zinc ribbon domain-containing protein [Candidatus Sulfotelmatobacter sp.]|nr:zinc ribbon domain-containing protein [Candidatus Sulfotelmatobacter sp.]